MKKITAAEKALHELAQIRQQIDLLMAELAAEIEPDPKPMAGPMVVKLSNGKPINLNKGGKNGKRQNVCA